MKKRNMIKGHGEVKKYKCIICHKTYLAIKDFDALFLLTGCWICKDCKSETRETHKRNELLRKNK